MQVSWKDDAGKVVVGEALGEQGEWTLVQIGTVRKWVHSRRIKSRAADKLASKKTKARRCKRCKRGPNVASSRKGSR